MTEEQAVVVVVDDDPSVDKALERLMRSAGYEVRTFTSALSFLDEGTPEASACLVLDVNLPGLNGLELQEVLGEKGILLPIVFITGGRNRSRQCQGHEGRSDRLPAEAF
jgi:FixJ family two-component response regulator